jgi:hypothetical protein
MSRLNSRKRKSRRKKSPKRRSRKRNQKGGDTVKVKMEYFKNVTEKEIKKIVKDTLDEGQIIGGHKVPFKNAEDYIQHFSFKFSEFIKKKWNKEHKNSKLIGKFKAFQNRRTSVKSGLISLGKGTIPIVISILLWNKVILQKGVSKKLNENNPNRKKDGYIYEQEGINSKTGLYEDGYFKYSKTHQDLTAIASGVMGGYSLVQLLIGSSELFDHYHDNPAIKMILRTVTNGWNNDDLHLSSTDKITQKFVKKTLIKLAKHSNPKLVKAVNDVGKK